jgi:dipeptidyl-peptidase-4
MKRASPVLGLVLAMACEPPAAVAPQSPPPPPPAPPVATPTPAPPVVDRHFLELFSTTRRFTRGTPQRATLTKDGKAVLFLRSAAADTKQSLFEMDVATGTLREVVTPESLDRGPEHLSAEERARRERMRITASGFTSFELSHDGATVLVTLSGRLYAVDRASGASRAIDTGKGAVIDPHLSPDGQLVAYVQDDDVHVAPVQAGRAGQPRKAFAVTRGGTEDRPHGLADFAASEELGRFRGFWWSPDSRSILFEDSEAAALPHLVIADPGRPDAAASRVAYPRAGTVNAILHFGIVAVAAPGKVTWVDWDRAAMPYVAGVSWGSWGEAAPPSLVALDRLQKNMALLVVDPRTGKTREAIREHDDAWVNALGPTRWLPDGSAFFWRSERDGDDRLGLVPAHDAAAVRWLTPAGTQVSGLVDVDATRRVAIVETTTDGLHYEVDSVPLDGGPLTPVARRSDGAVSASFDDSHDVFLARETSPTAPARLVVRSLDGRTARDVPSVAAVPPLPRIEYLDVGPDRAHVALVRPRSYVPGARYPLIDAAYGGPHVEVVSLDARSMLMPQWMADATGAIVVAIDARGTPGRGRAWERAIAGKLGDVPLEGHIDVIRALVKDHPEIDGSRVGVYGGSFGGYFSALAVLRHPDVYTAAVAIAPVTDWHNYDTAYTERFMGLPDANAAAYDAQSVVVAARAPATGAKAPELLIIHGTADDNVYFFNSLQLVDALAKTGRPFGFMPLVGQTHQFASPEATEALYAAAADALAKGLAK